MSHYSDEVSRGTRCRVAWVIVLKNDPLTADSRIVARIGVRTILSKTMLAIGLAAVTLLAAPFVESAQTFQSRAAEGCSRVASPSGSDGSAGTSGAPFRTARRLTAALRPGETGCLRAGTYDEDVKISRGGRAGAEITIRSYPGERALLLGRLWLARGADHVTIAHLNLDGRNRSGLPSPTVNASDVTFRSNDVTNRHTGICFILGSEKRGTATRTLIEGNRIHDCGRRPSTNHDHGIYVEKARNARIVGNAIFGNTDRGIQLYPDAQGTRIVGNVIDGNGQGILFAGDGGIASNDNLVEGNLITNSRIRHNVESYYPRGTPAGRGNVVRRNCVRGGARDDGDGGVQDDTEGFRAIMNRIADPLYRNRRAGDFRLRDDSPCRGVLAAQAAATAAAPWR